MEYRLVPYRKYDPYFKTAMNEALLESVGNGAEPVVFLAGWNEETVNVGRQQKLEEVLNLSEVHENGVTVVRRQGGGGATFLTPDGELTWGIVAPEDEFDGGVNSIYADVCGRVADAVAGFGIEAWHEPVNDVVTEDGKLSGATLRRSHGAVYIGGTLMLDVDPERMFRFLDPGEEKRRNRQLQDYRDRVTSMEREVPAFDREKMRKKLVEHLMQGLEYRESSLDDDEIDRTEELRERYSSRDWIYRR